jgi:tetratricopeptide (TPR) repeat protein
MSLWAELRRRKVFKVGAAYLVVGWLVVQSIAFPAFEAPPWALRVFILVLMLGFPVALVLAWVLDSTPEGVKVESSRAGNAPVYAFSAALIALALAWYFIGQPAYRGGAPDTAQLIQVSDGFHLWSETYDGAMGDVFELQERVARAVSDTLKVELEADRLFRAALAIDPDIARATGYQWFGESLAIDGDYAGALPILRKAIALDPKAPVVRNGYAAAPADSRIRA